MSAGLIEVHSSWEICKTNSLGSDFDALMNVQVMINEDTVDSSSCNFLDIVDMDNYLYLARPNENKDEERCVVAITANRGTLSCINLVTDARNIEIFIADSGQITSYWKTFKGRVIEELSELGSDTFLHEISFDCMVRRVELKLGKSSDENVYLFGLKVFIRDGKEINQRQNSIDFTKVETILSTSSVPISAGAERALNFLKQSGSAFGSQMAQKSPPNMETIMNLINQTSLSDNSVCQEERKMKKVTSKTNSSNKELPSGSSSSTQEMLMIKSYLDVRLKDIQVSITKDFDEKLKAFEERQNQKFDQILQILKKNSK